MNNKNIYVSGVSGFVGQNLASYLQGEFSITGMSRSESDGVLTYDRFLEKDSKYDVLIHLAGKAHDLKNSCNDSDYFEANFELTKKFFDAFLQSDCKVFIYMSSVKAVADTVAGVLTEESLPNPITAYGKSKRAAEEYILSKQLSSDQRVYILRPCMIHGPNNKGNLNLLYKLVSKGLPWPLGDFKNKRSFLSVENLCFVINQLIENKTVPSGIYNVADDEVLATNDLITLLALSLGKKNSILNIPSSWIKIMARVGDTFHLPLNTERLQKLTENYVVSNTKITKAIARSLPIPAKEGLLKTFTSFQIDK